MAYNLEEGLGFKIEAGDATLEGAELLYLPTPVEVFAGKEYDLSTEVKADLVGKRVIVRSEWAIISGTVYDCGDELTIYNDHTLTEGIVAVGYHHSDIPTVLHHEVAAACARAWACCLPWRSAATSSSFRRISGGTLVISA